jgi:peroxiredoxin
MMRGTHPRFAAGWSLAFGLLAIATPAVASDWLPYWPWSWSTPQDPKMAAVVAAVRAEEAKYRDLEYVARITVRDVQRRDPAAPSEITTMARRRVVFQGDRTFFRHEAFERIGPTRYRHEETSACDGERTRTVVAGNCANIHQGRWRHPFLFPAHSLSLAHNSLNFPLSTYLSGTRAIHAYLGDPPGLVDVFPWQTFRKVESHLEGEEEVDGLRCLKVRVDRWYQPNQPPARHYLWLAPGRNHLCIKEDREFAHYWYEMRVHELREAAPGIWFPARISVVIFQGNGVNRANATVYRRSETTVEEVSLSPRHEPAFFRDVAIPAGLPVFTVKDRRLVDATLPEPFDDEWGKAHLAALAASVADQERRYDDLEVESRTLTTYPHTSGTIQNARPGETTEERSVVRGGRALSSSRQGHAPPGNVDDTGLLTTAYDGEWTRWSWRQGPSEKSQGFRASLRRGAATSARGWVVDVPAHRPHTLIQRPAWGSGSLADLLAASPEAAPGRAPFRFRYCGDAEVDGHPCIELRGDPLLLAMGFQQNQNQAMVLYLAADRNHIPIKMVSYTRTFGQSLMPTSVAHCGDLREIAPGLWYPFRVSESFLDLWAMAGQGWALVNWRRETNIESVGSASRIPDAAFREVRVPAGTLVPVMDETGQFVGQIQQPEDGVPWLSLKRYLELSSRAQLQPQWQQARRKELDARIGQPAPDFPAGAKWLNGKPLSRESLRGRILILGFWAEWNDASRDALARLNDLHRDRAKDGLAVVGVHPPGSDLVEIASAIDALKLDFPTCVDVPGAAGANAWGELSGRLAVRSVPHAVVVDGEGKILASGRPEDVLDKARAAIPKGR